MPRVITSGPGDAGDPARARHGRSDEQVPTWPDEAETTSSGDRIAMRLPHWDLLPPTEFVQRHGRR